MLPSHVPRRMNLCPGTGTLDRSGCVSSSRLVKLMHSKTFGVKLMFICISSVPIRSINVVLLAWYWKAGLRVVELRSCIVSSSPYSSTSDSECNRGICPQRPLSLRVSLESSRLQFFFPLPLECFEVKQSHCIMIRNTRYSHLLLLMLAVNEALHQIITNDAM